MKILGRNVVLLVLLCLFYFPTSVLALVGSTPGEFSVTNSGASTYSIPIIVSPGTGGVQPSLMLNYSSQAKNGLLGIGWTLGGLSVIHRCPQTLVKDNNITGIQFDSEDRFCLDGQPLIAVDAQGNRIDPQSSVYGANNTEYRTQIDIISKIVSYDLDGLDGPDYFKVWTKSGEVKEYGNTIKSYVNPPRSNQQSTGYHQQSKAICWLLNKVSDSVGNYLEVTYHEDETTGDSRPDEILYTKNDSGGITSHYNSVKFIYEPRGDILESRVGKARLFTNQRLAEIQSFSNGSLFRKTKLIYEITTPLDVSRLEAIQECDGNDDCIPRTEFTWTQSDSTFSSSTWTTSSNWYSREKTFTGDFDGNGIIDIASYNAGNFYMKFSSGLGFEPSASVGSAETTWNTANNLSNDALVGDFNGDGLTDIADRSGSVVKMRLSPNNFSTLPPPSGSTFIEQDWTIDGNWGESEYTWTGDFNGDGMTDIVSRTDNMVQQGFNETSETFVKLSTGSGFTNHTWYLQNPDYWEFPNCVRVGDYNGDGLSDIVFYARASQGAYINYSKGDGFVIGNGALGIHFTEWYSHSTYPPQVLPECELFITGDFNGDGRDDLALIDKSDQLVHMHLSKGVAWNDYTQGLYPNIDFNNDPATDFAVEWTVSAAFGDNKYIRVADFNGDGNSDIASRHPSDPSLVHIYLSTGNGFVTETRSVNSDWGSDERTWAADFTGDGIADIVSSSGNSDTYMKLSSGETSSPGFINNFKNGLNASIDVSYTSLTDPNQVGYYSKFSGSTYPTQEYIGPIYAVRNTKTDNGIGGITDIIYAYHGARVDLHGQGFLGFETRFTVDISNDLLIWSTFDQSFPFIGQTKYIRTSRWSDGHWLADKLNVYDAQGDTTKGPAFPYVFQSVENEFDLNASNGTIVTTIGTTNDYDDTYGILGDLASSIVTTQDYDNGTPAGFYETHSYNYYNLGGPPDLNNWILGRLWSATVYKKSDAHTNYQSRTSHFLYFPNGLLSQEVIEPGNSLEHQKHYFYDAFGNVSSIVEKASGTTVGQRTTGYTYDPASPNFARYATTIINSLGHQETREFNDPYGNLTKLKGPNQQDSNPNNSTRWTYDALGRVASETTSDGVSITTDYMDCTSCPITASYKIVKSKSDGALQTDYFDTVNRVVLQETNNFKSTNTIKVQTEYDSQGRVKRVSNPYEGSPQNWTEYTYDFLGREKTITQPGENGPVVTNVSYSGLTVSSMNQKGQESKVFKNGIGKILWTENDNGDRITYTYDQFENVDLVIKPGANNVIDTDYNIRGFKTRSSDPDTGVWTYDYNVFGEVTKQTDANLNVVDYEYDDLGRIESVTENGGVPNIWTYDNAAQFGIGKIDTESKSGFSRNYQYDAFGNTTRITTTIVGTSYDIDMTYDSLSRLSTVEYPQNIGGNRFKVQYEYNSSGYLYEVADFNTPATKYYTIEEMNVFGNVSAESFANGIRTDRFFQSETGRIQNIMTHGGSIQNLLYEYDDLGNLIRREDFANNIEENFDYDNLNRLDYSTVVGIGTIDYDYDQLGNITKKEDMGAYYEYDLLNKPHAVRNVRTGPGGTVLASYNYDANGNMISRNGWTIEWSAHNKATRIYQGAVETTFKYGPDQKRYYQETDDGTTTTSTTYIGKLFEKVEEGTTTKYKHHILIGDTAVAFKVISNLQNDNYFIHRDHLGSIDKITNMQANITDQMSFDAFGRMRALNWDLNGTLPILSTINTRGYTDHEQLFATSLIHMNGRIYDPFLGRFTSADPFIQSPGDLQSFNRYSYVFNNPLTYTDPTGYIRGLVRSITRIGRSVVRTVVDFGREIVNVGVRILQSDVVRNVLTVVNILSLDIGSTLGINDTGGTSGNPFLTILNILVTASNFVGGPSSGEFRGRGSIAGRVSSGRAPVHGVVGDIPLTIRESLNVAGSEGEIIERTAGQSNDANDQKFSNGAISDAFIRLFSQAPQSAIDEESSEIDVSQNEDKSFTFRLPSLPQGLVDAAAGFGDGVSFGLTARFRNTFRIDGGVNTGSFAYNGSELVGNFVLPSAGTLRGGAALGGTKFFRFLNRNRFFRIGPGRMPANGSLSAGPKVPRASVGKGPGNPHIDLRVRPFDK